MARELEGYRDQLESVIAAFPDKKCLNVIEVARYTGISRKVVAKKFPFVGKNLGRYITRTSLARTLVDINAKNKPPWCWSTKAARQINRLNRLFTAPIIHDERGFYNDF